MFGYGRWEEIKEAAKETSYFYDEKLAIGLHNKTNQDIRVHANSFIRSICDNLSFDRFNLKIFLMNLIEESPDDPYVSVNASKIKN